MKRPEEGARVHIQDLQDRIDVLDGQDDTAGQEVPVVALLSLQALVDTGLGEAARSAQLFEGGKESPHLRGRLAHQFPWAHLPKAITTASRKVAGTRNRL